MWSGELRVPLGRTELAASWVLAGVTAGSALALGTVHTARLLLVAAVRGLATALAWWRTEPMRLSLSASVLLFIAIGLTLFTAAQCVPLPVRWLATIAPTNGDLWSRALLPFRESGPNWAPISLDPGAAGVEVLKAACSFLPVRTALRLVRFGR